MNIRNGLLSCFCLLLFQSIESTNAITYTLTGRFGDQLLTYCKAKWLSRKYGIDLLYKPFLYSDYFALHNIEQQKMLSIISRGKEVVDFWDEEQQSISVDGATIYRMSYFSHLIDWHDWQDGLFPKQYDPEFIELLRHLILLKKEVITVEIPINTISIAVHVRKSGTADALLLNEQTEITEPINYYKYADGNFPLKFPPDVFFIQEIMHIASLFQGYKLHVHIFTNDTNPLRLLLKYENTINNQNITFSCRLDENNDEKNVVEDLFSMMRFDCLIRGDSSYSKVAELLGNFKIISYPEGYSWQGAHLTIEKVNRRINT